MHTDSTSCRASAKESLKAYYKKIGGKPEKPTGAKSATKKRKANSIPGGTRGGKRGKSETPEVSSSRKKKSGNTVVKDEFKLPKGSWEDQVANIDTIEEALDDKGHMQRFVYVMWENGNKTRHQLKTVNEKCPQRMLRYYESHL
jgi:chromobox protein 1